MTEAAWGQANLGDLIDLKYGRALHVESRSEGEYPVIGSSGVVGKHHNHLTGGPVLIVGRKGTVGTVIWSDGPCWPIDTTFWVQIKRPLSLRWLYWLLSSIDLERHVLTTGVPGLNRHHLYDVIVLLPPLNEQYRIAEVLDAAHDQLTTVERVLAKKRYVETGLTTRMWHKSSVAWTIYPLREVASIASGLTLGVELSGTGCIELPYLRVANVQDGFIDTSEMKTVRVPRDEIERVTVQAGDVLLTEGGDFDKLGRGAVWDGRISPCLHQNHIFRVRSRRNKILPEFLAGYMSSPAGRRYFLNIAKQTTNLASINSTQLKVMPVPVPSVEEQLRLLAPILTARSERAHEEAELNKLQLVKQGLMEDLLTGKVRVTRLGELTG